MQMISEYIKLLIFLAFRIFFGDMLTPADFKKDPKRETSVKIPWHQNWSQHPHSGASSLTSQGTAGEGRFFAGRDLCQETIFLGKATCLGLVKIPKCSLVWDEYIIYINYFFLHYDHYECLHFRFPNIFFLPILP